MPTVLPYRPLETRRTALGDAATGTGTPAPAQPTLQPVPGRTATPNPNQFPVLLPPQSQPISRSANVQPITGQERPQQILPTGRLPTSMPSMGSYSAQMPAPGAGGATSPAGTGAPSMEQLLAALNPQALATQMQQFTPGYQAPAQSAMLSELMGQIRNQLNNPSPFDTEAYKASEAAIRESIDSQYTSDKQALEAQLAERGLGWGSTAASELGTLAKGKVENFNAAMVPLLRERAQMIAANKNAALNAGLSLASIENAQNAEAARAANSSNQFGAQMAFQMALERMGLGERAINRAEDTRRYDQDFGEGTRRFDLGFGEDVRRTNEDLAYRDREELRGERGYTDNLRTTARDQAIQEAMIAEQMRLGRNDELFRYITAANGGGNPDMDALQLAMSFYGGQGAQAGQQAAGYGDYLSQLAQFAGYFG